MMTFHIINFGEEMNERQGRSQRGRAGAYPPNATVTPLSLVLITRQRLIYLGSTPYKPKEPKPLLTNAFHQARNPNLTHLIIIKDFSLHMDHRELNR
jgi:hypothetical protein